MLPRASGRRIMRPFYHEKRYTHYTNFMVTRGVLAYGPGASGVMSFTQRNPRWPRPVWARRWCDEARRHERSHACGLKQATWP